MATPGSPSRRIPGKATTERDHILNYLSVRWGLEIQPPKDGESPSKRHEKLAVANKLNVYAEESFFKINFLCLKDAAVLSSALNSFQYAAGNLHIGWVYKPNADDDLLPRSVNGLNAFLTSAQREKLFECLLGFITPAYEQVKKRQKGGALTQSKTKSFAEASVTPFPPRPVVGGEQLDDTPIPLRLDLKGKGKRSSSGSEDLNDISKKAKGLIGDLASQRIIDMLDDLPVKSRDTWLDTTATFKAPDVPDSLSSHDRSRRQQNGKLPETANTSFTSNESHLSSVFDNDQSDSSHHTYYSTQTSMIENASDQRWAQEYDSPDEIAYGSSIDDFEFIDSKNLPPEHLIRERLERVFPTLPTFLRDAPLAIRYEITRVCCYTGVPITDLNFPLTDFSNFEKYDGLWNFLRSQPALRGKNFPERSDPDAWTASLDTFDKGFHRVSLSANLRFNSSLDGPFFIFQLRPLKLELSHRLGRRFGNDRFVELSIPSISGQKVPKFLKDAEKAGYGRACREAIVEWVMREHNFLGITWGAFYVKDASQKKSKFKISVDEEADSHTNYLIYLFATDGVGFQARKSLPQKGEVLNGHIKMTVAAMVDWLIPLEENRQQKSLKLFSRIALGLSTTWKTVELDPSEFRYPPDLLSSNKNEVMNDGCGRISLKMAINVVKCLGLSYIPSGFQARIGGAKGFWIVDLDDGRQQWIEIYPSQIKWKRSPEATDPTGDEADHWTFEVVGYVKPLKSAALNLQFLPVLEDCGKTRASMRDAISCLLVNMLSHQIQLQRAAMESPQSFRKWVRDNNYSANEERIKYGRVLYLAGLPSSLEEKLNMLLDAGFDPQRLQFLKDLAWKAYTHKCDVLKKKLNITVGRSTFAYMAVDFTGTLEPDEVHLGFSTNFVDDTSGFSDTLLDGIDILVARSPAHYVSDIQKVKAVWKRELKGLKDVIIFSSKGNFPLAKMLSGGDYDGDRAWICFDPIIVDEFVNAEMPECPDLVKLGYIRKEETTYADICSEYADSVSAFLKHGFNFNLQDNLLGMCSNFKEALCYTNNNYRNSEAVFLSTLLSDLVDQRKQGYSFTFQSWEKVRSEVIMTKVQEPKYKSDQLDGRCKADHIIDYLKFIVAEQTVEGTLQKFHNSLAVAASWDNDLVKFAHWTEEQANRSPDWKSLLDELKLDIKDLKRVWVMHFSHQKNPETIRNFSSIVTSIHSKWQHIAPPADNPLSHVLALPCLPDPLGGLSTWALLKASVGFSLYNRGKFIWWMAGKQLSALKAFYGDGDGGGGSVAIVAPHMNAMLKPDPTYVKLMQSQAHDPRFWEAKAESLVPEEDDESDEEVGG